MAAGRGGPADLDCAQDTPFDTAKMPSMVTAIGVTIAAEDLRHFEGRSINEICRTLGVGSSAAKHSVFRAVRKLRAALAPLASKEGSTC